MLTRKGISYRRVLFYFFIQFLVSIYLSLFAYAGESFKIMNNELHIKVGQNWRVFQYEDKKPPAFLTKAENELRPEELKKKNEWISLLGNKDIKKIDGQILYHTEEGKWEVLDEKHRQYIKDYGHARVKPIGIFTYEQEKPTDKAQIVGNFLQGKGAVNSHQLISGGNQVLIKSYKEMNDRVEWANQIGFSLSDFEKNSQNECVKLFPKVQTSINNVNSSLCSKKGQAHLGLKEALTYIKKDEECAKNFQDSDPDFMERTKGHRNRSLLDSKGKKYSDYLTDDQMIAIYLYSTACYKIINEKMREKLDNNTKTPEIEILADLITEGLAKLPKYKPSESDDKILYRGMSADESFKKELIKNTGNTISLSRGGFLSTSTDLEAADQFLGRDKSGNRNGIFFELHSFSSGVSLNLIGIGRRKEAEILFNPDAMFKIKSVTDSEGMTTVIVEEKASGK